MSKKGLLARTAAVVAVTAGLVLPLTAPSPAQAYWWRGGGWGGGWHGGWGGYGGRPGWGYGWRGPGCCWRGGVFFAPPPVYLAPPVYGPPVYGGPPVYYAPSAGYYPPPVVSGGSPYNPGGGASGYGQHPTE